MGVPELPKNLRNAVMKRLTIQPDEQKTGEVESDVVILDPKTGKTYPSMKQKKRTSPRDNRDNRDIRPPERNEWAMFQDCEPEQFEWCLDYERCREVKRIRDLVAKWSATSEWKNLAAIAKTPQAMFQAASTFCITGKNAIQRAKVQCNIVASYRLFTFAEYFPHTPFVSIPPKIRAERIATEKTIISDLPKICEHEPRYLQNNLGEPQPLRHEHWKHTKLHPRSFTVCCIDWTHSTNVLVNSFRQWVVKQRKAHPEFAPLDTREELRAQLKKLGALRLLRQMTWEQAADFTQTVLQRPLYSEQSAWSRAEGEAKQELEGFEARLCPNPL